MCPLRQHRAVGRPEVRGRAAVALSGGRRRKRRRDVRPDTAFNLANPTHGGHGACGAPARSPSRRSILPYVDNAAYYKVAVSAVDPQHVPSSLLKRYPKKCRGAAAFFSPRPQSSSRCTPQHPNQHFDTLQSPGTSRKDALACGPVPPLASQGGQQWLAALTTLATLLGSFGSASLPSLCRHSATTRGGGTIFPVVNIG